MIEFMDGGPLARGPAQLEVLIERGQAGSPFRAALDPIDAQWAARDKDQDRRNAMRKAFFVPPGRHPPSLGMGFCRMNRMLFPGAR